MTQDTPLDSLVSKYLSWCQRHRSPRTWDWYAGHLENFLAHLGGDASMPAASLKPYHVVEWVDSRDTWGDTYKRGAIVAVQRCLNWAEQMGRIDQNPVKRVAKPPAGRRDNPVSPEEFKAMLGRLPEGDPFRDFLVVAWGTGARPQEVRHVEPRHVDLGRAVIVIPKEEAKGKRHPRFIHLHGEALDVVTRLMAKRTEGKLFRNSRGVAWTKYAICNRAYRLSRSVGLKKSSYDLRHGFCQKLLERNVNMTVVAELMGHANAQMVSTVYSHMNRATRHLKEALRDASDG